MRRLQGYGPLHLWFMGAWQEGTVDLHSLLDLLEDNKVRMMGLAMGIGQRAVGQGEGKSPLRLQEDYVSTHINTHNYSYSRLFEYFASHNRYASYPCITLILPLYG